MIQVAASPGTKNLTTSQEATAAISAGTFLISMLFLMAWPELKSAKDSVAFGAIMYLCFYFLPREAVGSLLKRRFKEGAFLAGLSLFSALSLSALFSAAGVPNFGDMALLILKYLLASQGIVLSVFFIISHLEDEANNAE